MIAHKLIERLKDEEGWRRTPYEDTTGHWTDGYGFNLETTPMPKIVGDLWLQIIVTEKKMKLMEYGWFRGLRKDIQPVMIDMSYQLGISGLLAFKNMIKAAKENDIVQIAAEMLDSDWGRNFPNRA
jgi:lysozyme